MSSIVLKKYSSPESLVENQDSLNNPLSFKEWISRNYGIIEGGEDSQYQKYLIEWYSKKQNPTNIKNNYKELIKQLNIIFSNDETFRKISTLDLDDETNLKIVLPHYVKKLKEIALYYRDNRELIKSAKLKYNMVGSNDIVEKTFYEYLLRAFSKKEYTLNVPSQSAWNSIPELSSVNVGFSIEIENLYDDTDYYDGEDGSYSYDLYSSNPLLNLLDYIVTDLESSNFELSSFQIPLPEEISNLNIENIGIANDKYSGTNRFLLNGGYYINDTLDVSLGFSRGDNYFYWFSGEYFREVPKINYLPIKINDLDWENSGAKSGDTYENSDRLFVNFNGNIKGAWYSNTNTIPTSGVMSVNIKNNKIFKYPYPGIGLSSEGFEWTGKQIKELEFYNKTFFPDQTEKNKTLNTLTELYWTETDSISTVIPKSIHETSLIDNGAFASKKFKQADKIITRSNVIDSDSDGIYNGEIFIDWLYDFETTQLPISGGETKIYWPIQTYSNDDPIFLNYTHGDSILLNNIPINKFSGAVAGLSPESSDLIIKYESKCGEPLEAAWLAGTPLSSIYNKCIYDTIIEPEIDVNTDDLEFTPYDITSLKHWWVPEKVNFKVEKLKVNKNKSKKFNRVTSWIDIISKAILKKDGKQSTPIYFPDGNKYFIQFNKDTGERVRSDGLDALYFDTNGVVIPPPITISMVFRHDKQNNNHTLFETDTGQGQVILRLNDGILSIISGNSRISHRFALSPRVWHSCIVIINGANSKLIVNGIENLGSLEGNPIRKLLVGAGGPNQKRNKDFQGDIRDIIIFKSAITLEEQTKLSRYLTGISSVVLTRPSLPKPAETTLIENLDEYVEPEILDPTSTIGNYVSGCTQPSLSFKANPREFTRFIWTGEGNLNEYDNINELKYSSFSGKKHDSACPYGNLTPEQKIKLSSTSSVVDQWKLCNCQAIQYSPLGHIGDSFKENSYISDFIILDTSYPDSIGLDEWRGEDNLGWQTSKDFGWFKLDDTSKDENGWGSGRWVTNTGEDLFLKPGKPYLYYRSGFNFSCEAQLDNSVLEPFLIINQPLCNCVYSNCECIKTPCAPKWKAAKYINGVWVDTGKDSSLLMESGKFYSYVHRTSYKYSRIIENDEEFVDCLPSINFSLNVDLESAKPYWASGSFSDPILTKNKGMMYGGDTNQIIYDYIHINQPKPSTLMLTDNLYFEYQRNTECATDCFVWNEPLQFTVKVKENSWKELQLNSCIESEILGFIQNKGCESCKKQNKKCLSCCEQEKLCGCVIDKCVSTKSGVSATNKDSDIIFTTNYDGYPVFVNYYANNDFVLDFTVTDTTNGLAPTGGVWVDEELVSFNTPKSPWTNITNIGKSAVALFQKTDNLYPKKECGFFSPEKLSISILNLKNKKIELNLNKRHENNVVIIPDKSHYAYGPYEVTFIDSSWMKNTNNCLRGYIKNPIDNQEFIPYQTFYETYKENIFGIEQQSDIDYPFFGEFANNLDGYVVDRFGNQSAYCGENSWISNKKEITGKLLEWNMDLFGNQYGLYKSVDDTNTIHDKKYTEGKLWIRNSNNVVGDVSELLSRVIDSYKSNNSLYTDLLEYGIVNMEIFYDVMLLQTKYFTIFEKINIDSSTGEIYSSSSDSIIFETYVEDFIGSWLDEKEKVIYFALNNSGLILFKKIIIDTSELIDIDINNHEIPSGLTSVIDDFTLTYNNSTDKFTTAFTAFSGISDQMLIISNFHYDENRELSGEFKIIPIEDLGDKKLLKITSLDKKLLLIFEEQISPNQIYQIVIDN